MKRQSSTKTTITAVLYYVLTSKCEVYIYIVSSFLKDSKRIPFNAAIDLFLLRFTRHAQFFDTEPAEIQLSTCCLFCLKYKITYYTKYVYY